MWRLPTDEGVGSGIVLKTVDVSSKIVVSSSLGVQTYTKSVWCREKVFYSPGLLSLFTFPRLDTFWVYSFSYGLSIRDFILNLSEYVLDTDMCVCVFYILRKVIESRSKTVRTRQLG